MNGHKKIGSRAKKWRWEQSTSSAHKSSLTYTFAGKPLFLICVLYITIKLNQLADNKSCNGRFISVQEFFFCFFQMWNVKRKQTAGRRWLANSTMITIARQFIPSSDGTSNVCSTLHSNNQVYWYYLFALFIRKISIEQSIWNRKRMKTFSWLW